MKVAFITGVSGAIGGATALKFVQNGYFVVGTYFNNKTNADNLKSNLESLGYKDCFFPVKVNLNDEKSIVSAYGYTIKNFGHIDALILNAGVDIYKQIQDTSRAELENLLNINFTANYSLCRLFSENFIERKKGKIVFVSSIWGVSGASMESAYSASKFAIVGLCKSLAKELAPSNINVNCVCPGVIDTPMNSRFNKEELKDIISRTPLGRLGKSEEVASLIGFLASDNADFITGQAITVDGGFIL